MQIDCTNSTNYQNMANFKSVRYCPGYVYNEAQKGVFEGLKSALNTPISKNQKNSLVKLLEKNGCDLYVAPAEADSLQLFMANKLDDNADFKIQDLSYTQNIGKYSKGEMITNKKISELMDMAKSQDSRRVSFLRFLAGFAGAFLVSTISCIATAFYINSDSYNKTFQPQENVKENDIKMPTDTIIMEKFEK